MFCSINVFTFYCTLSFIYDRPNWRWKLQIIVFMKSKLTYGFRKCIYICISTHTFTNLLLEALAVSVTCTTIQLSYVTMELKFLFPFRPSSSAKLLQIISSHQCLWSSQDFYAKITVTHIMKPVLKKIHEYGQKANQHWSTKNMMYHQQVLYL